MHFFILTSFHHFLAVTRISVSVSVYYMAVRTIVPSRHGSNLTSLLSFMISFIALYICAKYSTLWIFWVSPGGNCAYAHWGSFTSNSKSVRRAIWFTWFSEPHECIQHLAVPGGHPSNYEPGVTLLNFSDRAQTVERMPNSLWKVSIYAKYLILHMSCNPFVIFS